MDWSKNSKIKYQKSNFRSQLREARGFKRQIQIPPGSTAEKLIRFLHLDKWWGKLLLFCILAGTFYLIYLPNIFRISSVEVGGVSDQEQVVLRSSAENFLRSKPWWPQNNLILLNPGWLKAALLRQYPEILSIDTIEKKLPSVLSLSVTPREPAMLWENSSQFWVMGNDGVILRQLSKETGILPSSTLPILEVQESMETKIGQRPLEKPVFNSILQIKNAFSKEIKTPVKRMSLKVANYPDIEVFSESFKVWLALDDRLGEALEQLALLLTNIGEQKNNLEYIDMRIKDRGFVCYKSSPCVKDALIFTQATSSTTTLETIK